MGRRDTTFRNIKLGKLPRWDKWKMVEDYISIMNCKKEQLDKLTEFAYLLNNKIEHSSAFCSKSRDAISKDFLEGISRNCIFACWNNDEVIGIINCYIDELKQNADCTLIIDSHKCDYNVVAKLLFRKFTTSKVYHGKYKFFFPKENIECANFLESINAKRQINEYRLLLEKRYSNTKTSNFSIIKLPANYYQNFIELHDYIFPGVYISGADVIEDIGKGHYVYTIIENGVLIAYSVLKINRDNKATAEIVAVKESFRGNGYGRAILSYLIDTAFNSFNIEKIDLIVDGDNEKAISLYIDLGFVIVGENKCYIAE